MSVKWLVIDYTSREVIRSREIVRLPNKVLLSDWHVGSIEWITVTIDLLTKTSPVSYQAIVLSHDIMVATGNLQWFCHISCHAGGVVWNCRIESVIPGHERSEVESPRIPGLALLPMVSRLVSSLSRCRTPSLVRISANKTRRRLLEDLLSVAAKRLAYTSNVI